MAPAIGTGRRRPEASGSPSSMRCSFTALTQPFSSPRISSGATRKWNSMPSSSAWAISSMRAGISVRVRRYAQMACLAPRRLAVRTESMATFPPPNTTTTSPRAIGVPSLVFPGAHEVDASQVLVGRVDIAVLAGHVEEHRQPGAVGDEHGVVLGRDLIDGDGTPDDYVALDLDAEIARSTSRSTTGQTELGDAVAEHAAGVVQGSKIAPGGPCGRAHRRRRPPGRSRRRRR